MKKAIPVLLLSVVLIISLIGYANVKSERDFLQKNIDQIFRYNFSELNTNIMTISLNPDMNENELFAFNDKATKCGNIASSLFSMTSFRENKDLNLIVRLLDQSSGNDALNSLIVTEELNKKLTEIILSDFSDNALIKETLDLLRKSVIEKKQ